MKHAFLIIAHDRPRELERLVRALDDDSHDIYVHIDKNSQHDFSSVHDMTHHSRLIFIPRMRVVWGGSSQVDVELALLHAAFPLANTDITICCQASTIQQKTMIIFISTLKDTMV